MKRVLVTLGIVVALLVIVPFSYAALRYGGESLSLSPSVVRPGQALTIQQAFRHRYTGIYIPDKISIVNNSGKSFFLTQSDLQAHGAVRNPQLSFSQPDKNASDAINALSGFVLTGYYQNLIAGQFYIESLTACPSGLGPPSSPPPDRSSDQVSITVLPLTPTGRYKVTIPYSYYCFGGPSGSFTFEVRRE